MHYVHVRKYNDSKCSIRERFVNCCVNCWFGINQSFSELF